MEIEFSTSDPRSVSPRPLPGETSLPPRRFLT